MDLSYTQYLRSRLSIFTDPVSQISLQTDHLCYPISYLSLEEQGELEGGLRDAEDDQLLNLSLEKDLPPCERRSPSLQIADGAAHLWLNREREPFVLLLGSPKIGKSSLLKKLALLILEGQTGVVPLLVSIKRAFQGELSTKMDFVEACFAQYEEFEAYLRGKFFAGKLALLLDGLDELASAKDRLADWVCGLRTIAGVPLCVITSRHTGYVRMKGMTTARMEVFPLKLQVPMASHYLSELQYERFLELLTGDSSAYSEFSTSPFLLALLLDLFRFGIVGTESHMSKGRLLAIALKHLLGKTTHSGLEALANDLISRDAKEFSCLDVKRLGFTWDRVKNCSIFISVEDFKYEKNSVDMYTDDDCVRDSVDNEEGIGDVRETPQIGKQKQFNPDTTPQWVGVSKESFITYQIARSYIDKSSLEKLDTYRFWNLQFQELLAAQHYCAAVEDAIAQFSGTFVMESSAFQKVFTQCFPANFFNARKYREVLVCFGCICSENIFENFLKFLLAAGTLDKCHLAERLLKERGNYANYRPLINKLIQLKLSLTKRQFLKAFLHPSPTVRRIARYEALEAGYTQSELQSLASKQIEKSLKLAHWSELGQLPLMNQELRSRALRPLFSRLLECTSELLQKQSAAKAVEHKRLVSVFISMFDPPEQPESTSAYSTPTKTADKYSEESTIRISFDRMNIPKCDPVSIDKLGPCQKLVGLLTESIQSSTFIDLYATVRLLITLNCSMSSIHSALAVRFIVLEDRCDRVELLSVLRDLGFVTQHTIDIPLLCLDEKAVSSKAEELLKLLNVSKLKKYALKVLMNDESKPVKAVLALRALGYASKYELDEEVVGIIAQFIDHYDLSYRLEALKSLYKLVKFTIGSSTNPGLDDFEIRKLLAATPHVLKDRLGLIKYNSALKIMSFRCLTALWVVLDRNSPEKGYTEMAHVLVQEHLQTSFLVGSVKNIFRYVKSFIRSACPDEQKAGWQCLRLMNCYELLSNSGKTEFERMVEESEDRNTKYVLKLLNVTDSNICMDFVLSKFLTVDNSLLPLYAKLLYKWTLIEKPRELFGNEQSAQSLSKYREILGHLAQLLDFSHDSADRTNQYKILSHSYKAVVNSLVEAIHPPRNCAFYRQELLDISGEPSYYNDESFVDESPYESLGSEADESSVPIALCLELLRSGIRSDNLKHWVLFYLKKQDLSEFMPACEAWALLNGNKDFYNPYVEGVLSHFLPEQTPLVAKATVLIRFKSDSICSKLIKTLYEAECDSVYAAIGQTMELTSSTPIEDLHKLVMERNLAKALKIIESLQIGNDLQLASCVQALCATKCSLLVQKVWDYWKSRLAVHPGYTLPFKVQALLEYTEYWDTKFLLRWAKTLGLMKAEYCSNESTSTQFSKRL